MPIRLLPKDELARKKSDAMVFEAQEGIKLARRVDSLRELQAKTEKEFEDYRRETLAEIGRQIEEAFSKKNEIENAAKKIERQASALLDNANAQLENLNRREDSLKKRDDSLIEKENDIANRVREIDIKDKKSTDFLSISEDKKKLAESRFVSAIAKEKKAVDSLKRAQKMQDETESRCNLIGKEKQEELNSIKDIKSSLEKDRKVFEKEKSDFEKEKIKFNDRKALLERNFARLHHGQ